MITLILNMYLMSMRVTVEQGEWKMQLILQLTLVSILLIKYLFKKNVIMMYV